MDDRTLTASTQPLQRFRRSWRLLRLVLMGILFTLATALILLFPALSARQPYHLQAGDVAPEDIRAPRAIEYISQIETEAARAAAAAAVEDIFDDPDPRVVRQQVRLARQIMDFVQVVRADTYADRALKGQYLAAITAVSLPPDAITTLTTIDDSQFDLVEREVISLIDEAMSGTVREGHVDGVINRLELQVSPDVPETLIPVVVGIAQDLIVPNSTLNIAATEAARENAVAATPVIRHTFQPGEIIVRAGDRVDEFDLEALTALGLATQQLTWVGVASTALISLISAVIVAVYLVILGTPWLDRPGHLLLVMALFLLFLVAARMMIAGSEHTVAYLFPAAALTLSITALMGAPFAALVAMVLALLVGYISGGSLEITAYTAISGLMAAGSLRRTTRLNSFFIAGLAAAVGGLAALIVFQLPGVMESVQLFWLLLLAVLNGLLSAGLALVILFIIGSLTGITTSLRLIDLMRPDHPLQRKLQQEALGTYQHTLSVANLVEAAAEAIGADSLLARVGTLYHDIGKATNPGFFVENRTEGAPDPHQGLGPLASARIIKTHVTDGVELARRYRLPPRVVDFITEHHGTMPILFFLHRAREEAQAAGIALDETPYYYSGPLPRSPETAILMLADGCESATRANRPQTVEEMEEIVRRIIQQRLELHQLDDSGLTLTQIRQIEKSFVRTLRGMYHPRIRYPDGTYAAPPEPVKPVTLPAGTGSSPTEPPTAAPVRPPDVQDNQGKTR